MRSSGSVTAMSVPGLLVRQAYVSHHHDARPVIHASREIRRHVDYRVLLPGPALPNGRPRPRRCGVGMGSTEALAMPTT